MNNKSRIIVCGLNGSGKTTLGKMYAGNMRICIKIKNMQKEGATMKYIYIMEI